KRASYRTRTSDTRHRSGESIRDGPILHEFGPDTDCTRSACAGWHIYRDRWQLECTRREAVKQVMLLMMLLVFSAPAFAGSSPFFKGEVQGRPAEKGLPKAVQNVGIDQKLGDQISLDLPVRDEEGRMTTLGAFF